ncbi:ATP-dependent DNA helicase RecG [Sulfurimonas sp. MAG313]|nr:ATP-dependent DNA helicase RecG [Sulfurimonas sp. MAG313]MDF1881845.1 ATP-dependent DNA helicase RecG [Sulfurimonas sp. MAG313]
MPVEEDDLAKFKKLGCSNLIELALILPQSYEDRNLYSQAKIGQNQLLDIEIKSFSPSIKFNKLIFFCFNLNTEVDAVLFQPKPYHRHQFIVAKRMFVYGKVELNFNKLQMVQPRIVKDSGGIIASYKTSLRQDVLKKIMKKYINLKTLMEEGLGEDIASLLIPLHFPIDFPALEGSEAYAKNLYALKFTELYNHLKILSSKKESYPALISFEGEYDTWTKTLPFMLTEDQLRAISKIQKDMTKNVSAKRMVVGDVGSGKTMVILACAYMAKEKGSVLMAPTTVLANQLFEEAQKFLPSLKVGLVTNKTKKKEDLNQYDFLIGTHALLYRNLKDRALVMIDEQHRFGTAQRNKLSKMMEKEEARPHFIQFSATPIPRTQAMINSSLLDVSLITQTPFKKDINTKVIHKNDFAELLNHIQKEIKQDHQVLIVYPLVEQSEFIQYQSIEEARGFWENKFDKVYVTHGKDKEKEKVLVDFREKGNILLATTVVEVGISLPNLSTVVIVGAERLGLSTLHQLRGRVSRTGLKGYCYLYTNTQESVRLKSFSTTISGFDIARLDLQYRKSGDLLSGNEQSGQSFQFIDMANDEELIKEVQKYLKTQGVR